MTIPNSVTYVDPYVFRNCSSLTEVTIPDSMTSIAFGMFEECRNLKKVTVPNSITSIGSSAFSGCTSLSEVIIPNGVKMIAEYAFYNCTNLSKVTIPDSVTTIGGGAFGNTKWLENKQKENPLVIINHILIDGSTCSGAVVIPDDVTYIPNAAFSECTGMIKVTIPGSVTTIGLSAFRACTGLTEVMILDGVKEIESNAFNGCTNLKKITIPDSVTYIAEDGEREGGWQMSVFGNCPNLTIYGKAGSYAETFAKEHGIPFAEEVFVIDQEQTNSAYVKGSGEAVIRCSGDLAKFLNVYVDGTLIDKANYTLEEGSTIIKFSQAFMDTLSAGEHIFTLEYMGNVKVDVSITIAEAEKTQADSNAKTGDTNSMVLWIMLALASAGCVLAIRKKVQTS